MQFVVRKQSQHRVHGGRGEVWTRRVVEKKEVWTKNDPCRLHEARLEFHGWTRGGGRHELEVCKGGLEGSERPEAG